jgi:hypothetical protein
MSATPPARASDPAAGHSTRLLLDELDTLMQKMLALPVNQLAEGDAAPTSEPAAVRPPVSEAPRLSPPEPPRAPHFIAGLSLPQVPQEIAAKNEEDPFLQDWPTEPVVAKKTRAATAKFPSATSAPPLTQDPLTAPEELSDLAYPDPAPVTVANDPVISSALPAAPALPSLPLSVRWLVAPAWWCNHLFDRATRPLGSLGRWLRSVPGRSALGWVGVTLWVAAILWGLLKWIG